MKSLKKKSSIKLLTNQSSQTQKQYNSLFFNNNKGIAAFNLLKTGAIAVGIAAILGGAMALALDRLAQLAGPAVDGIGVNVTTNARLVALNGTEGILQMFTLLPTQGIILGIVVLIAIVLLIKTNSK